MIQISRSGVRYEEIRIDELTQEFRERKVVRLPELIEPSLLDHVRRRMEVGPWQPRIHPGIGDEYTLNDLAALSLLHFVANFAEFRGLIARISGSCSLRRFQGRIYRMFPGRHHDDWHDDDIDSRAVGLTLNLSSVPFRGGLFLMRARESGRMLAQIANTGQGDALIFKISKHLEHRVADVEGDEPKTAFAGWFKTKGPQLVEEIRALSGQD